MVWEPKTCCCGCSLKTGTLILGWLGLVGSALMVLYMLTLSSIFASTVDPSYIYRMCLDIMNYTNGNQDSLESCARANDTYIAALVLSTIIFGLTFAFCVMLICGVNQNKPKLMLPYLICQVIRLVFVGIVALISFVICCYYKIVFLIFIVALKLGFIMFLEVYFFLIVRACYKQVKQHRMAMSGANKIAYMEHQDIPSKM